MMMTYECNPGHNVGIVCVSGNRTIWWAGWRQVALCTIDKNHTEKDEWQDHLFLSQIMHLNFVMRV